MKDILVNRRYRVDCKIGRGGFGLVYAGTDTLSNNPVALKLTGARDEPDVLQTEAETYSFLSGGIGIPRLYWHGWEGDFYVLAHELLGPSLEDLLKYCEGQFSLKTLLLVADQAISRIEYIHGKGFLHCDIKPENFVLGVGKQGNTLYAIDFGASVKLNAKEVDEAARDSPRGGRPFIGTRRYASLGTHNGQEQSYRDDLESLGYMLLYCFHGSLPWQGLKARNEIEKDELIKARKSTLSVKTLCSDLPSTFAIYMGYVRSLEFQEKPNYAYLRRLFDQCFSEKHYKHDNVFDWTAKRFGELQLTA